MSGLRPREALSPGETRSRTARTGGDAPKAAGGTPRASEGCGAAVTGPQATWLPGRDPDTPQRRRPRLRPAPPLLSADGPAPRFYFRGTCLRLPGPFSKSDAFVSRGGVSPFPPRDGAPCVGADVEMMSGWCGQARGGRPTTSVGHACAAGPGRPARWPGEHAASPGLSHAPGLHPNLLSPPSPPAARPCQRRVPATSFYLLPIVTTRYQHSFGASQPSKGGSLLPSQACIKLVTMGVKGGDGGT